LSRIKGASLWGRIALIGHNKTLMCATHSS
jgi:hypothetical protein